MFLKVKNEMMLQTPSETDRQEQLQLLWHRTQIAIKTVKQFLDDHPGQIDEVYWVLFDDRTLHVYEDALSRMKK